MSNNGSYLPIAWRMMRKGENVAVYTHNKRYKTCYDGLLHKLTVQQIKPAAKSADKIIVDGNIPKAVLDVIGGKEYTTTNIVYDDIYSESNGFLMNDDLGPASSYQMGFVCRNTTKNRELLYCNDGAYNAILAMGDKIGYAVYQKITIPPYPYNLKVPNVVIEGSIEDYLFFYMLDVKQEGKKLICAGTDGVLGYATAFGKTLKEAVGRLYHNIGKIKVDYPLQYRTDFLKVWRKYA